MIFCVQKYNPQILALSLILLTAMVLTSCEVGQKDTEWPLEEIEAYLKVELPHDATNIKYGGTMGYGVTLDLSFEAEPESAIEFASAICGPLLKGYNPFDAVNTGFWFSYAYMIDAETFTYFSYTPDAPEVYLGNRCGQGRIHQILVDTTLSDHYKVRFHRPPACNTASPPLPCGPIGIEFIKPIEDLPITVVGIRETDNHFLLYSDEICIDTELYAHLDWQHLAGSDVQILVDDQLKQPAYIDGSVIIKRQLGGENAHNRSYDYCVTGKWESGLHTMHIIIETEVGDSFAHSWEFLVE